MWGQVGPSGGLEKRVGVVQPRAQGEIQEEQVDLPAAAEPAVNLHQPYLEHLLKPLGELFPWR